MVMKPRTSSPDFCHFFKRRSESLFPKNKEELINCVQRRECSHSKEKGVQHVVLAARVDA